MLLLLFTTFSKEVLFTSISEHCNPSVKQSLRVFSFIDDGDLQEHIPHFIHSHLSFPPVCFI